MFFGINWKWLLAILAPLLLLFGGGCAASGKARGGKATVRWEPAIHWTVDTSLGFGLLAEIRDAEVSGEAETTPDDGG